MVLGMHRLHGSDLVLECFKGVSISTVLFNAGFNTSFEHLTLLQEECGYQFRDQSIRMLRVLVTGYADDIGLLTGSRCGKDAFRNNKLVLKRLPSLAGVDPVNESKAKEVYIFWFEAW